jgi:hypothetical protein
VSEVGGLDSIGFFRSGYASAYMETFIKSETEFSNYYWI